MLFNISPQISEVKNRLPREALKKTAAVDIIKQKNGGEGRGLVLHNIDPVFDSESEILILGSFPSVKSREAQFFYAHPQNRFWRVTSAVFGCDTPVTVEQKKAFLKANHIALWDVIAQCEVSGSADTSIRNAVPNDIPAILSAANIRRIYVNGKTAEKYYNKYILPASGIKAECMPSTSPANAACGFDELVKKWSTIKRTRLARSFLGREVTVKIDRPKGYVHRKGEHTLVYPVNYGYIPGVTGGDGEEIDVYLLGVDESVCEYNAVVIGIAYRADDCEDKLVATPPGVSFTADEIYEKISFQEQWFDTTVEALKRK